MYLEKLIDALKHEVDVYEYVDVGIGAENIYCSSRERFLIAVKRLEEQGYSVTTIDLLSKEHPYLSKIKILSKEPLSPKVLEAHRDEWSDRRKRIMDNNTMCMVYRNVVRYHLDDFNPIFYKDDDISLEGFDRWKEMGFCSRLIVSMIRRGALDVEIRNIVAYSMVLIDTEKKHLNWRKAAEDFQVKEMTEKYYPKYSSKPAAKT